LPITINRLPLSASCHFSHMTRYEDALYEAGCDDALVAIVDGTMLIDFDREAPDYDRAVQSAIQNVERAGGKVVAVEPIKD
jgi:hypothetical protein